MLVKEQNGRSHKFIKCDITTRLLLLDKSVRSHVCRCFGEQRNRTKDHAHYITIIFCVSLIFNQILSTQAKIRSSTTTGDEANI